MAARDADLCLSDCPDNCDFRHRGGKLELDFESDNKDIRNPEAHEVDLTSVYHRTSQVESSEYLHSLRVSSNWSYSWVFVFSLMPVFCVN